MEWLCRHCHMNVGTMLPDLVAEEMRFGLGWNSTSTTDVSLSLSCTSILKQVLLSIKACFSLKGFFNSLRSSYPEDIKSFGIERFYKKHFLFLTSLSLSLSLSLSVLLLNFFLRRNFKFLFVPITA